MPRKVTVDANGVVVAVESVPEKVSNHKLGTTKGSKNAARPSVLAKASNATGKKLRKSSSKKRKTRPTKNQNFSPPKKLKPLSLTPEQAKTGREYVRCSKCEGVNIRATNWKTHLENVHVHNLKNSPKANGSSPSRKGETTVRSWRPERASGAAPSQNSEAGYAVKGLIEETRFGDKYIGQHSREADGRFGSISLYDDYSEESYPD